jgi:hypothetical protein
LNKWIELTTQAGLLLSVSYEQILQVTQSLTGGCEIVTSFNSTPVAIQESYTEVLLRMSNAEVNSSGV